MMEISRMRSRLFGPIFIAATMAGAGAAHAAGAELVGAFDRAVVDTVGGARLERVRFGIVAVSIPIHFAASQTTFTPAGEQALQELVEAAKRMSALTLVGHAAPRGRTHEDNMNLSRRRVIAVRDKLVENDVRAEITIAWRGDLEPFDVSALPDSGQLSQDEIWRLDDRVEWVPMRSR
jgi:outer membrane protein OmpA-like peptidoglycan-associated protein